MKGDDHGVLGINRHVKKKEAELSAKLAYCCVLVCCSSSASPF